MAFLTEAANRGSIATGYDIENSVKLQTAGVNSEFFNYTIGTTGSRTKGTVSMWIKRTSLGTVQYLWEQSGADNESGRIFARFGTDDTLRIATGSTVLRVTNRVFRDASAWYHIVVAIDTTSGTADNRTRLYVNGVEETSFSTTTNFSQNDNTGMNFGAQYIGLSVEDESSFQSFNGYMAEVFGADGLVYAASDFGEFDEDSGIWKPIDITGLSVGTNGFLMKFENAASMGAATSGHGFSVQNINQGDQATDTPTNNFCTLNPVMLTAANTVISQGATSLVSTGNTGNTVVGTMGVSRGKWYWEFKDINHGGTPYWPSIGYTSSESTDSTQTAGNSGAPSKVALLPNGSTFVNGTILGGKFNGFLVNDIAGVALDMDNGDMYLYKNGTIQNSGNPIFTSIGDFAMPVGSVYSFDTSGYFNFGGFTSYTPSSPASDANGYGTFEYAPPTGYYALCTKNLAEYG